MSKDSRDTPAATESFNLDKLKELIELMEKHDLTEVNLRQGGEQWRLRRGGHEAVQVPVAYTAPQAAPPVSAAPAAETPAAAAPATSLVEIKSPIVGTFYSSPSPDDPAFVQVGATVGHETVVCIVEAMKVFNQITADTSGTIAEILVENGDPIESGQPLFRVRPN